MIWFCLLIPIAACFIMLRYFPHEVVWWEFSLPIVATVLTIFITKTCINNRLISDIEYRGAIITRAEYYESWTTWKHKTCSYTTCSGGKYKTCVTHYYDCSYCDEYSAKYYAIDNEGNKYTINQEYFNILKNQWKATLIFHELNRNIKFHGSCGQDGDMYVIKWDNNIMNSEASVWTHYYENKIQVSHSAFKMPKISKEQAQKYHLFDYPDLYSYYKQPAILGLKNLHYAEYEKIQKYYEFFNGYNGTTHHVKLFMLFFWNKPLSIVQQQKAYWDGGNDNELVVCAGVDSITNKLDWVQAFTWCDNKRVIVEAREELMQIGVYDPLKYYAPLERIVQNYWKPKDFHEFDYLSVELPTAMIVLIVILSVIVTLISCWWAIANDFTNVDYTKQNNKKCLKY